MPLVPGTRVGVGVRRPGRAFHLLRHAVATQLVAGNVDIKIVAAILGHSTSRILLERYAHESEARRQAALEAHPGIVGHVLSTAGWAEAARWTPTHETVPEIVVDGRRLELPTSALPRGRLAKNIRTIIRCECFSGTYRE
jgi:hypothetical protein